jgi:hypothetical protein
MTQEGTRASNLSADVKYGTDWKAEEIRPVVTAYFIMLEQDILGASFNKAAKYRELSALLGRTVKSIERKFQNISAVLDKLEEPWIRGLAPLINFQSALSSAIEGELLARTSKPFDDQISSFGFNEAQAEFIPYPTPSTSRLNFVPPPNLLPVFERLPDHMERLVRKFDPVMRDFRAREIGDAGERLVFMHEKASLESAGLPDLARKVVWVSKELGDGAGYDIKSFDVGGREKFIEVKTTVGSSTTPFFMTRNEKEFADEADTRYRISRIFDFRRTLQAFELTAPLDQFVRLSPESYRASFS